MKDLSITFMLLCLFCFMVIDMRQIFAYKNLAIKVNLLQKQEQRLLDKHKQLVASIAVMSSFSRLEMIAEEKLHLQKLSEDRVKKVVITSKGK